MPENCIFCKIVKADAPSYKIYEDDKIYAFLDIMPKNPGHLLVIPKEHYENIFEISEEDFLHLMKNIKKLAKALMIAVKADGINIIQNNFKAANQSVMHLHFHIVPRYEDDDIILNYISNEVVDKEKLLELEEKIKKAID